MRTLTVDRAAPRDLAFTAVHERQAGIPTSIALLLQPRCLLSFSPLHPLRHHGSHLRAAGEIKRPRGQSFSLDGVQIGPVLQQQLDLGDVVLLERAEEGNFAVAVLVVDVRAGAEQDAREIWFWELVRDGVCESGESGDVGNVDGEPAGDEVVEDLEMLEGVAWGPALYALSAGDDEGRVAEFVGCFCAFDFESWS